MTRGAVRVAAVPATRPYPWPWDGVLEPSRMALVLAGTQRWWAERTEGVPAALAALGSLRAAAHARGVPVIAVRHAAATGPRTSRPAVLPAPGGPDAVSALAENGTDIVVAAAGVDGCYGGPLEPTLRSLGVDRVLLAGLGLAGPVHSTLRSLNDQGYECLLVADACSHEGESTRDGAVSSVLMSGGIFGAVGEVAAVLDALSQMEVAE
jgi:nicotinamidase-related amidase